MAQNIIKETRPGVLKAVLRRSTVDPLVYFLKSYLNCEGILLKSNMAPPSLALPSQPKIVAPVLSPSWDFPKWDGQAAIYRLKLNLGLGRRLAGNWTLTPSIPLAHFILSGKWSRISRELDAWTWVSCFFTLSSILFLCVSWWRDGWELLSAWLCRLHGREQRNSTDPGTWDNCSQDSAVHRDSICN